MGDAYVFWQSAVGQLIVGFLSNLLFILVLTAVGVLYVRTLLSRRSRPLRRLLGVDGHASNRVRIMVSSIYVLKEGALGVRVAGPTGFYGPVMNQSEYVSAQLLRDAIRTRPASRPLRALLDQLGLLDTAHDPIECEIVFSPQYVDGADGNPVGAHEYRPPDLSGNGKVVERIRESVKEAGVYIFVGGPAYNAVVAYILANLPDEHARFTFELSVDGPRIVIEPGRDGERSFRQHRAIRDAESVLVDYFVLQRISGFGPKNSTVFVCSGLSSLGTAVAVGLLASRWRDLERRFGDGDFALLYKFDNRRDIALPAVEDVDKALATIKEPIWPPT
jgi:hypothetical protein